MSAILEQTSSGGGYRYSLKCVEKGTIPGSTSKTFTSTYGGELRLYLGDYYPSTLVVDGVDIGNGNVADVFLSVTNGSTRVFTIPFSTSVQVTARSAYEGYVEEYVLYTYQRIAETT